MNIPDDCTAPDTPLHEMNRLKGKVADAALEARRARRWREHFEMFSDRWARAAQIHEYRERELNRLLDCYESADRRAQMEASL